MSGSRTHMFQALRSYNFRVLSAGALVSNIGAWMQRIAQDWLVLTGLTHHDATAVGWVVALQFLPQVLLLPWTGWRPTTWTAAACCSPPRRPWARSPWRWGCSP